MLRDIRRNFEPVEIHPVFELVRPGFLDQRRHRAEQVAVHPLVGVADVFGHQRQQDPAPRAVGHPAREQVEEEIERRLAAAGDGHVLRADVPPVSPPAQPGEGLDEPRIAARRVVGGQRPLQAARLVHQLRQPPPPERLHLRDPRRLAAA